ncbi:PKD domain-containing protein [Methanolobus mangrovi]|uniref:PKD domain-containing protein n=1 Tax=Methanolobus mangrovi TaxID=3072977 RepID=A0AA51UHW9_9EURY|nr:PKD domain-containing protein [Methanolobus mangrovi]WMW23303.1 PKD domain-containing protein [Methanolobus mangrovi]
MEKQGLRIFAYFAAVLMLVSILPAGALAASDNAKNFDDKAISGNNGNGNGNVADDNSADEDDSDDDTTPSYDRDRDRIMDNASEDVTRKRTENMNAESDYKDAKIKYSNIKSKNPNLNSEEAINTTKEYLNSSIDYMISLLDAEDDADYIEVLEEERDNVEAAETRKELADAAKNIRSIWNDARKDRVVTAGKAIDNKINAVLKTSESLIVRLQNEIDAMEENGEDVEDLTAMLDEYKELIDDAREKQEQARSAYMYGNVGNGENIQEANRYLAEAGEDIRDANAILKNMLKELKKQREGVVVLTGNETLEASGNGTAVISGDVEINITANEYAKLVIKDLAGNAKIILGDETTYETSNIDAGNSTDNNRAFVFINLTGDVYINGSRLTVMLQGSDVELTVKGTGTAVLSGDGIYYIGDEGGEWANRYIDDDEDSEDEEPAEEEPEEEDDSVTVVANFTYTVDGLNVTFNDTSMNASSWNWDFDDGNNSIEQNPTHEYALSKEYNVTLTSYESDNDKLNNDSITQTINLTV